jgi:hypothetical protein
MDVTGTSFSWMRQQIWGGDPKPAMPLAVAFGSGETTWDICILTQHWKLAHILPRVGNTSVNSNPLPTTPSCQDIYCRHLPTSKTQHLSDPVIAPWSVASP